MPAMHNSGESGTDLTGSNKIDSAINDLISSFIHVLLFYKQQAVSLQVIYLLMVIHEQIARDLSVPVQCIRRKYSFRNQYVPWLIVADKKLIFWDQYVRLAHSVRLKGDFWDQYVRLVHWVQQKPIFQRTQCVTFSLATVSNKKRKITNMCFRWTHRVIGPEECV